MRFALFERIVLASRRKPSVSDPQTYALRSFEDALQLFQRRRFRAAVRAVEEYRRHIAPERFDRTDNRPQSGAVALSVIVVAYRTGKRLLECIESVLAAGGPQREVIVVDNGGNESVVGCLESLPVCHLHCPINLLLSEGRNVGVSLSRAQIVAFVDDDAVVRDDYVGAVLDAFGDPGVAAVRGRVLPRDAAVALKDVTHYDLGELPTSYPVNAEGNSAFRREVFTAVGGMDPLLFGHEGLDISYRIARRQGTDATIYWPRAVIFHDYAATEEKRRAKDNRHALMWKYLGWKAPGLKRYVKRMRRDFAARVREAET